VVRGAEEVAVVAGALFGAAEGGVSFADLYEAVGGVGVVGVEVGVVGFGEFVELSVRVLVGFELGWSEWWRGSNTSLSRQARRW
jgi:hypothetical protein